ncbi:MAG: class I SAM-dependent rRNA methyltransferase [Planctomycetaceae bacterium]|nr:class I SAM-dependent rRNA methyltransferase [Planctomycetaceae bacterium]
MPVDSLPVVRIKPRRALPFFSRHPWVFAGAIHSVSGLPQTGDQVIVRSHEGQFIGYGLFNPESNIRVRMYSWEENRPIEEELFVGRVEQAVRLRTELFAGSPQAKACRLIFSEGDRLSGLTVDQYGDWLAVQWTSAALRRFTDPILDCLSDLVQPQGIWLRTEKGIKQQEGLNLNDGLVRGESPPSPLVIPDGALEFEVDLCSGQKTGFYFDQRDNRQRIPHYLRGDRVLDLCCYTGGFSLHAAKAGESVRVTGVDSSASALEVARRNAERNGLADRVHWVCEDVFDFVEQQGEAGEQYDLIVLDPPKLARTRGGLNRALKAYVRLNRAAMRCLRPGGTLVTCSCSGHVSRDDFDQIVAQSALEAGSEAQILERRGQAADHPVFASCLETSYLKCTVARVFPTELTSE